MRVLIADSSQHIRGSIKRLISHIECIQEVLESTNVQEAIDACQYCSPEAIVLDYKLIGGNSMDVLETVRLNNSGTLVIVLYTAIYPQIKHQCLRTGANYVLDKSNEFDLIPELLRSRCSNNTPIAN